MIKGHDSLHQLNCKILLSNWDTIMNALSWVNLANFTDLVIDLQFLTL